MATHISPLNPRRSHVFIDVPNLRRNGRYHKLQLPVLLDYIQRQSLQGTNLLSLGLYVRADDYTYRDGAYGLFAQALRSQGIAVRVVAAPREKDIDHLMVNHIWLDTAMYLEAHNSLNRNVRHVLVTGDADFIAPLEDLTRAFVAPTLRLETHVYAWHNSCALEWRYKATRVYYMDDIPHIYAE